MAKLYIKINLTTHAVNKNRSKAPDNFGKSYKQLGGYKGTHKQVSAVAK